jgi:hypothetical protein
MEEAKRTNQNDLNDGKEQALIADIALLDCCEDILELLNAAKNREKSIALAIVARYGVDAVKGEPLTQHFHVDAAIQAKRNGDLSKSIFYYNQFFQESSVGKAWFMTYYGIAKTLAIAGDYTKALTAISIAIILASITGCADEDYIHKYHYKNIYALMRGAILTDYLNEIRG